MTAPPGPSPGVGRLDLRRDLSEPRFCTRCGRRLEVVSETSRRRDATTGKPLVEQWLECPRRPRNGFVFLFRGNHDSLSVDNALIGRSYR